MSLGNDNNTGDRNKVKEPTSYSLVSFSNPESNVDKTSLSFMYKFGLLDISIAPKKTDSDDYVKYDYENKIEIWLSHQHAMVLYSEIKRLMKIGDPNVLKSVGVYTKKDGKLLTFGYGIDYGVDGFVISICKLSPEGDVQNAYHYEFTDDKCTSIVNFDYNNKSYEKNSVAGIEVESFLNLLEQYFKSATGAHAYMNQYYNRYNSDANYKRMSAIMDKLGVADPNSRGNYSRGQNQPSFFDGKSNGSNNFRNTTLDNMGGEVYED